MNLSFPEAIQLVGDIRDGYDESIIPSLVICPPFPFIKSIIDLLGDSKIMLGAQNCSSHEKGAFTGEVSAEMLATICTSFVILGHSERRAIFGETNEIINQKITCALRSKLKVIFCCGETLQERESGKLEEVIAKQLMIGLSDITENISENIVIAYEPVWAIGTGKTASPDQAQEVHAFIRQTLYSIVGPDAGKVSILYGGSCNAGNAASIFSMPDIDGGLIGGASLKSADFLTIARSF